MNPIETKSTINLIPRTKTLIVGQARVTACQLIAEFKEPLEVIRALNDRYDLNISEETIKNFTEKHEKEIGRLRAAYLSEVSTVPIANEKIRLERTEDLYKQSQKLEDSSTKILRSLDCLRTAREETKGVGSQGLNVQFNQFNELTDEEIVDKKAVIEKKIMDLMKKGKDSYA